MISPHFAFPTVPTPLAFSISPTFLGFLKWSITFYYAEKNSIKIEGLEQPKNDISEEDEEEDYLPTKVIKYIKEGFPVESLKRLENIEYDIVLIAVLSSSILKIDKFKHAPL